MIVHAVVDQRDPVVLCGIDASVTRAVGAADLVDVTCEACRAAQCWHLWVDRDNPATTSPDASRNTVLCHLVTGETPPTPYRSTMCITIDRSLVTCPSCREVIHA